MARSTASLGLDYNQAVAGLKGIHYHADAAYRSNVTTLINNCNVTDTATGTYECPVAVAPDERTNNFAVLDGFTTLNASVAFEFNDQWQLRAYGTNLTNELGITAQFMSMPAAYNRDNYQFVTRPRTLGLEVRYQLR